MIEIELVVQLPDPPGKPFLCDHCGGVVGYIERNGSKVARLVKYDGAGYEPENVVGVWDGPGHAACPDCRRLRTWHASQQWLNDLIARRG